MKMKLTNLMVLATLLGSFSAFAGKRAPASAGVADGGGIGENATYLTCKGQDTEQQPVKFLIRSTAVPTYKQGLLKAGASATSFKCSKLDRPLVEGTPSAGTLMWECVELTASPTTEGMLTARIERNSQGIVTGKIARKQMFPLADMSVASLACQETDSN